MTGPMSHQRRTSSRRKKRSSEYRSGRSSQTKLMLLITLVCAVIAFTFTFLTSLNPRQLIDNLVQRNIRSYIKSQREELRKQFSKDIEQERARAATAARRARGR